MASLINPNPVVYAPQKIDREVPSLSGFDGGDRDDFDAFEIFELIRRINDPEHPLTLEQLNVARYENISVDNKTNEIVINFTPTVPHCSMATLIGLCIRVKLIRSLPSRFKVDIKVTPGAHASEAAVNKQLNDKERVAAALENSQLLEVVTRCIANTDE
eukprot:TRINITY_DN1990_c0_g2_i1.p1 TRINITY_DN1990_c0_g2~~TRINITY_DN1990_c0_g2_i1.p1  ORF type:complete len:159 (-),score=31.48 TRINITY_DN1990_c0_g2_i1:289-765(-)